MNDNELFEQLARGPLVKEGFDDDLRSKIHQQLDATRTSKRKLRPFRLSWLNGSAAVVLLFVIVLAIVNGQQHSPLNMADEEANVIQSNTEAASSPYATITNESQSQSLRSAVLIGLRKDTPVKDEKADVSESSYRTILIAPEEEELVVAASGKGIWMPFEQTFWHVDAVADTSEKGGQKVIAATAAALLPEVIDSTSSSIVREKLLYVSNRYLSLMQSKSTKDNTSVQSDVWVKDVTQLTSTARADEWAKGKKTLHYTVGELTGIEGSAAVIDQWTIARSSGQWVAEQPTTSSKISEWQEIDAPLSDQIVSHDKLALTWNEIYKYEPFAKDAFTSPTKDLLAVVVNDAIHIYAYQQPFKNMKQISIPLEGQESVIMVQWAQDKYVDSWKHMLRTWIPSTIKDGI
ncbi:MAG: hypothetical protein P0Y55_06760 [Candidatus Cohnella colombiensis]|uniref:Uncharacterized protein n=1 Tax=Candidatus Cohnella colombiensis TaxID=3121368 RepID=A0AA95EYA4_9BACL|nr:MAG: hypothetical protein P0Y55_06760 [Cohnella sp.]